MKVAGSIVVMLVCLAGGVAFAQPKPEADHIVAKMTKDLALSQDQIAAVTPIIANSMAQRKKLMEKMQAAIASIHSQMEKLKEDEKQKLSQVLSKDQMDLLAASKNKKHVRHTPDPNASLNNQ